MPAFFASGVLSILNSSPISLELDWMRILNRQKRSASLVARTKRIARTELKNRWLKAPIVKGSVLYETYSGNGVTCSPEALFRHMLSQEDLQHLNHIWVLNDFNRYNLVIDEFKNQKNVCFVLYGSLDYFKALATSEFLINNVTFPTQFTKRDGQIYINTWHGVPLKKMGYDIQGRAVDCKNIIRNFLSADYLLSSSSEMTQRMYLEAFKLTNIFNGAIIEEGSPRTDRQHSFIAAQQEFQSALAMRGMPNDDRKIILYAPTWKGESYFSPHNDAASLWELVRHLESSVDNSKYRILVKAHQVVSDGLSTNPELSPYLVPNSVPTNVVLGASAMLITDYSSIFYDFMALDRPVLFYIPDLEEYRQYRDLYIEPSEFPGHVAESLDELSELVLSTSRGTADSLTISSKYESIKKKFVGNDDGEVCKRVVDVVIRNLPDGKTVKRDFRDHRKRVLIYAGGMAPNGITTSALNLLDNIDYERFDITVLCPYGTDPSQQHSYSQVNKNARLMFRFGTFNGGYLGNLLRLRVLNRGINSFGARAKIHRNVWNLEWKRCFGDADFDHMVDFSGYTPFWGTLFLHGPDAKRSIWLHNDLAADAHRSIAGNTPLKDGLFATFQIYKEFDNLVSVSEGLRDINEASLAAWAPSSRFSWASNTINSEKIMKMALGRKSLNKGNERKRERVQETKSEILGRLVYKLLNPDSAGLPDQERRQKNSDAPPHATIDYFSFISVGRLSPEKNHTRLVDAFARVHKEHPQTRLVIAGDGPLKGQLQKQVQSLGLASSIKLVGHTRNPYKLMNNADVFVLSSDYEGQPMVLLEALVLGLPVITTSFGSVAGALPAGVGTIVEPQVEALSNAMIDAIEFPDDDFKFDVNSYNKRAVEEFEAILNRQ